MTKSQLTKSLKAYFTKKYGRKCKDPEPDCYTCIMWRFYDLFIDLL